MPYKDPTDPRKKENQRQANRRYRQRHPPRSRGNSTVNRRYSRAYHLLSMYGLTEDIYNQMAEEQNHACKICNRPAQLEHYGKLHVDHIRGTKVVRGLLCANCNRGLGLFKDKAAILFAAAEYLQCQTSII